MFIHVSNLSYNITEESLSATFASYGKVTSAFIFSDQSSGQKIYYALLEMPNQTEATEAVAKLNGAILDGRFISAQLSPAAEKHRTENLVY